MAAAAAAVEEEEEEAGEAGVRTGRPEEAVAAWARPAAAAARFCGWAGRLGLAAAAEVRPAAAEAACAFAPAAAGAVRPAAAAAACGCRLSPPACEPARGCKGVKWGG